MSQSWIKIEGELVSLEETPLLLNELNLMPIFLRRFLEKKFTEEIIPNREEQTNYYQKFLKREKISDKTNLDNWLKFHDVSESEMEINLYKSLKIEKFKNEKFADKVEDVFLKRKSDLDRVTYSLIRSKSRDKISELNMRLKEEEDTFSELSSEFSEGVENVLHGLIGPIEISKVNPVIAERLKASKSGQLWPPFECEGWWVLLRHERFIPSTLNIEMRNRLINELYEVWIASKIKTALNTLKESVKE
tara:strand:+ start:523 stop:1266 length:744 start_codon:yes stop_codon:yes gene_type:complete